MRPSRHTTGSIYPSVQNLLLAARAMGLGACLITLPLWSLPSARRDPRSAALRDPVLHRATRLAAWALRADDPQTGRAGDASRCLRQPRLARHLERPAREVHRLRFVIHLPHSAFRAMKRLAA